ncbi:methyltransferase domain-containing protein [bacterium]|nr:methyltransferase domain-containing protein [bacterium]
MAEKDFGSIETDYEFFMAQSTEAESDIEQYVRHLSRFDAGRTSIRWLDFGCGNGEFTQRLLSRLHWSPALLQLTLMEPVRHQRQLAARRLAGFSRRKVETWDQFPDSDEQKFDLIISNHVLYYVDNLQETVQQMARRIALGGKVLLAMASWENELLKIWKAGFGLLGIPVPYYTAEDVEAAWRDLGFQVNKTHSDFELRFPDSEENRLKILRFLLGEYLPRIPIGELLNMLDRYVDGDEFLMETFSESFVIQSEE